MTERKPWQLLKNTIPALYFCLLAATKIQRLQTTDAVLILSTWLVFLQLAIASVFFILRNDSKKTSLQGWDVVVALSATFAPSFFKPLEFLSSSDIVKISALSLQVTGNIIAVFSTISLGKSIGILPANRGVKTQGMYRWVRHPIYAGYLIANTGFFVLHPTMWNAFIALVASGSQIFRLRIEEKLLAEDPDYQRYQSKVRWRLMPFIY